MLILVIGTSPSFCNPKVPRDSRCTGDITGNLERYSPPLSSLEHWTGFWRERTISVDMIVIHGRGWKIKKFRRYCSSHCSPLSFPLIARRHCSVIRSQATRINLSPIKPFSLLTFAPFCQQLKNARKALLPPNEAFQMGNAAGTFTRRCYTSP